MADRGRKAYPVASWKVYEVCVGSLLAASYIAFGAPSAL